MAKDKAIEIMNAFRVGKTATELVDSGMPSGTVYPYWRKWKAYQQLEELLWQFVIGADFDYELEKVPLKKRAKFSPKKVDNAPEEES